MLTCIAKIRWHFQTAANGSLICSRDLLDYGSRGAMDQAVYVLVHTGEIKRIARGMFVTGECDRRFSPQEIAETKAAAFGRKIYEHGRKLAERLHLVPSDQLSLFGLDRCSSSFGSVAGTQKLNGISGRKAQLGDDKVGKIVKALWNIGAGAINGETVRRYLAPLSQGDRQLLFERSKWMPYWLLNEFRNQDELEWRRVAFRKLVNE